MWPILLKVLSIIGIVLACIIGVVLFLVLLCLLCPIVYKIDGKAHEGNYNLKVRIHYLFGLIRAGYDYPEPGNIYARIAWYHLYDSKEPEEHKKAGKKSEVDDKEYDSAEEDSEEETFDEEASMNETALTEVNLDEEPEIAEAFDEVKTDTAAEEIKAEKAQTEEITSTSTTEDKSSNRKKEKKILNPIYHIKKAWENFKYKIVAQIKIRYKDISFYKKLLLHEDTQGLLALVKKKLIKILKQLKPKFGHCNIEYGMDSPDTTAYIYGVYSVVFVKKTKKYVVIPNFEEKMLEGDLHVGGFFNLIGIVVHALPIVLSKKLRKLRARLDRHSDNMEACRRKAEKKYNKAMEELEKEYSA